MGARQTKYCPIARGLDVCVRQASGRPRATPRSTSAGVCPELTPRVFPTHGASARRPVCPSEPEWNCNGAAGPSTPRVQAAVGAHAAHDVLWAADASRGTLCVHVSRRAASCKETCLQTRCANVARRHVERHAAPAPGRFSVSCLHRAAKPKGVASGGRTLGARTRGTHSGQVPVTPYRHAWGKRSGGETTCPGMDFERNKRNRRFLLLRSCGTPPQ